MECAFAGTTEKGRIVTSLCRLSRFKHGHCLDGYQIPEINDILSSLGGAKYFTGIDMTGAYHQVPIAPEDVERAFTAPNGHYEYLYMPFGLLKCLPEHSND